MGTHKRVHTHKRGTHNANTSARARAHARARIHARTRTLARQAAVVAQAGSRAAVRAVAGGGQMLAANVTAMEPCKCGLLRLVAAYHRLLRLLRLLRLITACCRASGAVQVVRPLVAARCGL